MKPERAMQAHPHRIKKPNGRRHFSRKKPEAEKEWNPKEAIRAAFKKFSPKYGQDLASPANLRYTLQEIADCLKEIPFSGGSEKGFRCVVEISMLYPKPSNILSRFEDSLRVVRRVAESVEAGNSYAVAPGREQEAAEFMRKLRWFTSLSGLESIRKMALSRASNGFSDYRIEFVSWQEVERISELKIGLSIY